MSVTTDDVVPSDKDPGAHLVARRVTMRRYDIQVGPLGYLAAERERLTGLRAFTAHLAAEGLLAGADTERAADECWVLTSLPVFAQLTVARGWSAGAYRDWLARMLGAVLLPAAANGAGRD